MEQHAEIFVEKPPMASNAKPRPSRLAGAVIVMVIVVLVTACQNSAPTSTPPQNTAPPSTQPQEPAPLPLTQSTQLLVSFSATRASHIPLDTAPLAGQAFPFVVSPKEIREVRFHLDDPSLQGNPIHVATSSPYDFAGSLADGTAVPFDTTQVSDGTHSIAARVAYQDGTSETVTGVFSVTNSTTQLSFNPPSMPRLSDAAWDETAVRKVLHAFAYGGHATDRQIKLWADMAPQTAIMQMLTFDQHNALLSPASAADHDRLYQRDGTLRSLAAFWSSSDPGNAIYVDHRIRYDVYEGNGVPGELWSRATVSRGLNPFRQKIGFWETNYHLATNRDVVRRSYMVRYFDDIMNAHAEHAPYQDVLTVAATSAAVAVQYGHDENIYINDQCLCNEDFAREYHQLFFGILGQHDPEYHEVVSIKNTALALTDMQVQPLLDQVFFGSSRHYLGALEILNASIGGFSAHQKINHLSQHAITHPESLDNLPVIIIQALADDNLNGDKINRIRAAWSSMQPKNLLDFLRSYAISTVFHNPTRVKYLTSVDRHMLVASQRILNNEEGYLDLYPLATYETEDVKAFHPAHNVFGGQTGAEAADSADVFLANYNRSTSEERRFRQIPASRYGRSWEQNWMTVIPKNSSGTYIVKDVTEWLWKRFIGDGLKNLGLLERAHIYAFLAEERDIVYLADQDRLDRAITTADLTSDPRLASLVQSLGAQTLPLDSADSTERGAANARVRQAINFIVATPYIFAQEGG
jgi:hypothetical protein